jgi:hypothetical protein
VSFVDDNTSDEMNRDFAVKHIYNQYSRSDGQYTSFSVDFGSKGSINTRC